MAIVNTDPLMDRDPTPVNDRQVRPRAFVMGVCATVLVNLLPAYSGYVVHSSRMVFGHLPMATMIVFATIVWPFNIVLRQAAPHWVLARSEMIVVLAMVWIGGSIPAANFMGLLLGGIAAPHYYATPENRWGEFLLDSLPTWAVPSNRTGQMTWFFEGKPSGSSIPWDAWMGPLAWWGTFLLALAFLSIALVSILRKQWVERERLPFPLAEAPLMMTEEKGPSGQYALLGDRLFWIGFALPFTVLAWNALGSFWHTLPHLPVLEARQIELSHGFPQISAKLNPFVMGFAYFTNLDVLFSLWFFYAIGTIQIGLFDRVGFTIGKSDIWGSRGGAALGWQAMGAFTLFTLLSLWVSREHLRQVWRKAVKGDPGIDDSNELMGFRAAVLGGTSALLYLYFWLCQSGMSFHVAAVYLFALVLMTLGVTRFVAETGLLYARMPIMPQSFTFRTLGIATMTPTDAGALSVSYATFGLGNTFGASTLAHIARLGAELRIRTRTLLWSTVASIVLSLVISGAYTIYLAYVYGAYNFNVYTFNGGNRTIYNTVVTMLQTPFGPDWKRAGFFGIGAVIAGACALLRRRFMWWSLSPIGLTVFTTGVLRNQVFTVFVTWLTKGLILRIGGITAFRKSVPFTQGMMVGYVAGVALVFVVDWVFFPGQGHMVHRW
jgi:hypothetical protein